MQRYYSSLEKLEIPPPLNEAQILDAFRHLVKLNQIDEGMVYMQITRGVADRDFVWPEGLTPTVFMFTQQKSNSENEQSESGITLASVDDIRWARRDIKTVNLLAQVLAKKQAKDAGADEALMVDRDGNVTECGCTSFYIVKGDSIMTRPLSNDILPGVTRRAVVDLCNSHGLNLVETCFTLDEALGADEAFISAASSYLMPVIKIDEQTVSDGQPGKVFTQLRGLYLEHIKATLT